MDISLESAVKEIVLAVADDHGLTGPGTNIAGSSKLDQDLGMDELDVMEAIYRLESRFNVIFPDDQIQPSSTIANLINCLALRLSGKIKEAERGTHIANQLNPNQPDSMTL
jgi:acyl carrier protein